MLSRQFPLILATMWSVVLAGCTMCNDDRPAVDEKVGTYGKSLGEAKEGPSTAEELRLARQRFIVGSQVQLAEMATEIERRAQDKKTPIERVEALRKDYWVLVEQRGHVLDSTDQAFPEALGQFEVQVNTIREQLARLDRGQLP